MSASAEMPYFINPSRPLSTEEKERAYAEAARAIRLTLGDDTDDTVRMVTINCLLKTYLPYYYWVGFYRVKEGRLVVGPYQGTLGCLFIEFGRGVCGAVAVSRRTKIVADTHVLLPGSEHIACDPNSRSEIVVPVFDRLGELMAVFDVDSSLQNSFDAVDQKWLEQILAVFRV